MRPTLGDDVLRYYLTAVFALFLVVVGLIGLAAELFDVGTVRIYICVAMLGGVFTLSALPSGVRVMKYLIHIFILLVLSLALLLLCLGPIKLVNPIYPSILIAFSILFIVPRYVLLRSLSRDCRKYLSKVQKRIIELRTKYNQAQIYLNLLTSLVDSYERGLGRYIREDYEVAILTLVKGIEGFLKSLYKLGLIPVAEGFTKQLKCMIGLKKDEELDQFLLQHAKEVYSIRSKYAHGKPVEEIKKPIRVETLIKELSIYKELRALIETLVVMEYSRKFMEKALVITEYVLSKESEST